MKKLKYYLLMSFLVIPNLVNAQVWVRTDSPADMKTFAIDSSIKNVNASWGAGTVNTYGQVDPWFWDIGTTGTIKNQLGSYINVDAEYYVGLAYLSGAQKSISSYLESARNTLKNENLRCGFGGYAEGYDNSYAPNVYLEVELVSGTNPAGSYVHEQIKIKFKYTQQIQYKTHSGNVSCWFVRQPSDGLAFQFINNDYSDYEFYTYTEKFDYSLAKSQDTILLEQINTLNEQIKNNQQTIIDQNNQIIDNIGGINSSINDSTVSNPQSSLDNLGSFVAENSVISQLITMPITLYRSILNSINGSCSAMSLGSLYDTNLTIPCINIENYIGSSLWGVVDVIISGFFIYSVSKKMIKVFNHLSSLGEGDVIDD